MPMSAARPGSRPDAKPVTAIILAVVAVIGLQFTLRLVALNRAERYALDEAAERIDAAAGAVAEGLGRQIDAWSRLRFFMGWIAGPGLAGASESQLRGLIEEPLARIADDPLFAISAVTLARPQGVWRLGHGPEAPPDALPAPRPGATEGFTVGLPVETGGTWLIPLGFQVPSAEGPLSGVITLDGRRLSDVLARFEGRPGQRVGLWRGDGRFLAGSFRPEEMVARKLVSPLLPGAEGRGVSEFVSPADGAPRILAARSLPGQDLFIVVSVSRAAELAQFTGLERLAVVLEVGITAVLIIFAVVLIELARARARTQMALVTAGAEHRRAQEVAETQRAVLEGVAAGVYTIQVGPGDAFARQDFNGGAARLIRRSVAELQAVRGVSAYAEPPTTAEDMHAMIVALRATGTASYEARCRCGDGELRWFRFQVRVVRREGEVLHCIGLITDVETEKAAAAAAVMAARLATLGELSAGIAHEMKQPLAAISLIAETAQLRLESATPPSAQDLAAVLARVTQLVQRASSVTDHLSGIARNQDDGDTDFDVAAAVEGALLLCGFALRQGNVALETALPAGLPRVVGHQVLAEQVLMNLFMNARDAMAEMPAKARRLRVAAVEEEGTVRLTVRDSGPGIPDHVMPRLFEAFFTTKPKGVGTGLGLSICASILKACGGGIAAANPAGGGAEFTITLLAITATAGTEAIA